MTTTDFGSKGNSGFSKKKMEIKNWNEYNLFRGKKWKLASKTEI